MKILFGIWSCTLLMSVSGAFGQPPDVPTPQSVDLEAPVASVTVFRGRATVIRRGSTSLSPGLFNLRIAGLPESLQSQTLQARVVGPARVLEVQYDQVSRAGYSTPETEALDQEIADLEQRLGAEARALELIEQQDRLLVQFGVRTAGDATNDSGTERLDLDIIRRQFKFVADERRQLLEARGEGELKQKDLQRELTAARLRREAIAGASQFLHVATVTVAVTEPGEVGLALTYLVTNASWQPSYNIRSARDGSGVDIEYDALITQRTGENWDNVQLTLSTAQPNMAANPPQLEPWFVDVRQVVSARRAPAAAPEASRGSETAEFLQQVGKNMADLAADAQVTGEGPSVTYLLPRPVTVQTNIQMQQRSRITTIRSGCDYTHFAVPQLSEAVYVRGELTNASAYHLLPGLVSIFVEQDYVGPTQLEGVPPDGSFELFFGIDPAIKATRTLIEKKTSKTGLLGGGLKTAYDYRIEILNGAGKAIMLELWDRIPVSRSDQITVDLVNLSHALSLDPDYVEQKRPLGLLMWNLGVPIPPAGSEAFVVTYSVRINRAKDVEMDGLPE